MSIIAHYGDFTNLEETNSMAYDLSGNNNAGYLIGAIFSMIGARGRVLNFGGSYAYVEVPDSPSISPSTAVSVGAWIHKTESPRSMVVGKNLAYRLWFPYADNIPYFSVYAGGAWRYLSGSPLVIPQNQWVFLQGGYDSATDTIQIYCQGSLNAESSSYNYGPVNDSPHPLFIGRYAAGTYYFKGYMGEIIIRDELVDLTTHRADLKRWLKERSKRVIEFLELHIGGGAEPVLITTQATSLTATVDNVLNL